MSRSALDPTPSVLLSVAMSLDGCIDDDSKDRLILSNTQDWEEIDRLRAEADAILVGAGTIRADNPRLLVRSESLVQHRIASGRSPQPLKVTLTRAGDLTPDRLFFRLGESHKLVYCPQPQAEAQRARLQDSAEVIAAGNERVDLSLMLRDLAARGVKLLMIEGGTAINTQFLAENRVDELRLMIAPKLVGSATAPRIVHPNSKLADFAQNLSLVSSVLMDDCAVLHYRRRGNG